MEKINNGILGLIVGDALGVPAEFKPREELEMKPVTGMSGYGTHHQPPGTWSDDSSMALGTAEIILDGYDLHNLAQSFVSWYFENYWTPRGEVFDSGITTGNALERIKNGVSPKEAGERDEMSNGNGSLMRILPLLYLTKDIPEAGERYKLIREVSSITHAHERSCLACFWYLEFADHLLKQPGAGLQEAYAAANNSFQKLTTHLNFDLHEIENFSRLLTGKIQDLPESEIRAEGYVIYTLEASIWCLLNTGNYKEAVLKAVNLGDDTDTTGAVAGGLAGIFYGRKAMPQKWIAELARLDDIEELFRNLDNKHPN